MTIPVTPLDSLKRYRMEHPAARGDMVLQGHADACEAFGHGTWVQDGVYQPLCSRCGAVVYTAEEAAADAALTDEALAEEYALDRMAVGSHRHLQLQGELARRAAARRGIPTDAERAAVAAVHLASYASEVAARDRLTRAMTARESTAAKLGYLVGAEAAAGEIAMAVQDLRAISAEVDAAYDAVADARAARNTGAVL